MRHFRINSAWIAASLVWISVAATAAKADVIYNYKGNLLSVCSFGTCPPDFTTDYLLASLSFANPLGANLSNEDVSGALTAWSMLDALGLLSFSSSDPNSNLIGPILSTNAAGDITEWALEGFSDSGLLLISNPPLSGADAIQVNPGADTEWDANSENPGQWSRVNPVPEPSTFGAVLLAGAALAAKEWKRRAA